MIKVLVGYEKMFNLKGTPRATVEHGWRICKGTTLE